jgi:AraC-like DNA-binding protein
MAGEACYSKYHFLRLFKTLYGRTPHQYLTELRIENAKQLLQAGRPTDEVCFSVGFDSVSSFKALFKRYTMLTPFAYRKQLEQAKQLSATPFRFCLSFLL